MANDQANDLQAFRGFIDEQLNNGGAELTLDDALALWEAANAPEAERQETLRAIQRGLDDMYAGRTRSFEEFDREFRERHGLPPRA